MRAIMPKAYGIDFRKKILEAYRNKEGTIPEISTRFKVSQSTVKRITQRYRETGDVVLYLHNAGRHELIDDADKQTLAKILVNAPYLILNEIQEKYSEKELQHYFVGELNEFKTPLLILGSSFQKQVWQLLQNIPPGNTLSYDEIAKALRRTIIRSASIAIVFRIAITPCAHCKNWTIYFKGLTSQLV
jgi:O6-methylguanine-DNA--protein-cysteine methyltransferase